MRRLTSGTPLNLKMTIRQSASRKPLPKQRPSSQIIVRLCIPVELVSDLSVFIVVPYKDDKQGEAATRNPHLKLLFRLSKFYILDDGECRVYQSIEYEGSYIPSSQKRMSWSGTSRQRSPSRSYNAPSTSLISSSKRPMTLMVNGLQCS